MVAKYVVYFQVGPSLSHCVVNVFAEVLGNYTNNNAYYLIYQSVIPENVEKCWSIVGITVNHKCLDRKQ